MGEIFTEGKQKWEEIRKREVYRPFLDRVKEYADSFLKQEIKTLSYQLFEDYFKTGVRIRFETEYFSRRGRLDALAIAYLAEGEEQYLKGLEDCVWAICEEFTWALPAHIHMENIRDYPVVIDLFAAETGFALSEIKYLLQDSLSPKIQERISYEIRRRIIEPFLNHTADSSWETWPSNWSAVCGGSVGAAFLYEAAPEEVSQVIPRIEKALGYYLQSLSEDGACTEGYNYWIYGFGFFVYYASLLRQYTDGQIDYFKLEKVKRAAAFQNKVILRDNKVVTFSDSSEYTNHMAGLSHFLFKEYGVPSPSLKYAVQFGDETCYRWPSAVRNLVWLDETHAEEKPDVRRDDYAYLDAAQWYIKHTADYIFAAKCGNNAEPHNHNDVGVFLLDNYKKGLIADLGNGEYVKDYFSDRRYEFLVNSSRGHSVPIINGQYQKAGLEYRGTVLTASKDVFEIEMNDAYGIQALQSLKRRFCFSEYEVRLTDIFVCSEPVKSIVERFIFLEKPEIQGNTVSLENMRMEFSPEAVTVSLSSESYSDHAAKQKEVYLLDFTVKKCSDTVTAGFVISFGQKSR